MAAPRKQIPDDWLVMMDANDTRVGLPPGTTYGIVKTETGFQERFLNDPAAAHYSVGPKGEKPKSSAAGLGGILKDTAAKPGYGVTPLKDWSVPEQLRFIADYASARVKNAGSVESGLAGYGEGKGYAQKVISSKPNAQQSPSVTPVVAPTPTTVRYADVAPPPVVESVPVGNQVSAPVSGPVVEAPQWAAMQQAMPVEPVKVANLDYAQMFRQGQEAMPPPQVNMKAFRPFGKWGGRV